MTFAFRSILCAAAVLLAGAARALPAQEIVFVAFGDSVTDGYGDTSGQGGYTGRLQRWLRDYGHDATVNAYGVGGETTTQGLSRIDDVLDQGGDYLLLMEGTNDISGGIGIETIRFNLDEMANRAEIRGMTALHASVIPRIPTAPADSNNARTNALAEAVLALGLEKARTVVDVFHLFESLPDLFENYYYYNEAIPDPVGHPNSAGYAEIAGLFLETLLPILEGPQIQIVPVDENIPAGVLQSFSVNADESIVRVEWSFGDGGIAVREAPDSFDLFYIFREAGNFTVSVLGRTATGATGSDSESVHVTGPPLAWGSQFAVLSQLQSSSGAQLVTELLVANESASFGLVEATFLPDIHYDDPPQLVRLVLFPGETFASPDFIADVFGLPGGRGGLIVERVAATDPSELTVSALLRSVDDDNGSSGCESAEIPESDWTSAAQEIGGIAPASDETVTVHVTNLDASPGSTRLDLFDAVDGYIGSSLFVLPAGGSRQRELGDLFRGLESRPKPLRATFASSGVRYSAGMVLSGHGQQVSCLSATP